MPAPEWFKQSAPIADAPAPDVEEKEKKRKASRVPEWFATAAPPDEQGVTLKKHYTTIPSHVRRTDLLPSHGRTIIGGDERPSVIGDIGRGLAKTGVDIVYETARGIGEPLSGVVSAAEGLAWSFPIQVAGGLWGGLTSRGTGGTFQDIQSGMESGGEFAHKFMVEPSGDTGYATANVLNAPFEAPMVPKYVANAVFDAHGIMDKPEDRATFNTGYDALFLWLGSKVIHGAKAKIGKEIAATKPAEIKVGEVAEPTLQPEGARFTKPELLDIPKDIPTTEEALKAEYRSSMDKILEDAVRPEAEVSTNEIATRMRQTTSELEIGKQRLYNEPLKGWQPAYERQFPTAEAAIADLKNPSVPIDKAFEKMRKAEMAATDPGMPAPKPGVAADALSVAAMEAAQTVNDYVSAFQAKMGLSIEQAAPKMRQEQLILPKGEKIASISPVVEERWQAAHGLSKAPVIKKMIDWTKHVAKLTKQFPELKSVEDAVTVNELRKFKALPEYGKSHTEHILRGIVAPLTKEKYNVFERNIILPDIIDDVRSGRMAPDDLPFGYKNIAEMEADYSRFRRIAAENKDVVDALRVRQGFVRVLTKELVDAGRLPKDALDKPVYFHRQVLDYMRAKEAFVGVGSKEVRLHKKGWQQKRRSHTKDFNTQYLESEFEFMAQALVQIETKKILDNVMRVNDISEKLKGEAKLRGIEDPMDLIPEGYTTWQANPGHRFYVGSTIPEKLLSKILEGEAELDAAEVKRALIMGSKNKEYIIPERVAKTLNEFRDYNYGHLENAAATINNLWKQWTLLNPFRAIKYNLNNASGDFDIVLAHDPRILRYLPKAFKELADYAKGRAPTQDIVDGIREGNINSGMTAVEIPDILEQRSFMEIAGNARKPWNALDRYWQLAKRSSNFRENLLRLAAQKHFRAEIAKGKNPLGASSRKELAALDKKDLPVKLARELLGDYGATSKAGEYVARHLIPFYRWMEINAPRYVRLIANAPQEGRSSLGGVARVGRSVATRAAWGYGKLALKVSLFYGLAQMWNQLAFNTWAKPGTPEEERDLERIIADRKQFQIILGRRDDGSYVTMRLQGALTDAMSWFGLTSPYYAVRDLIEGQTTAGETLEEAVKAPVNRLAGGALPITKGIVEAATGKSLYPDVFEPRTIRDRTKYIAQVFSLNIPYNFVMGKPSRNPNWTISDIAHSVAEYATYTTDPGETAYYKTMERVIKYMDKKGVDLPSADSTKKSNALYYYRQALKYGDKRAQDKYKKMYLELGGNERGIEQSIKRAHPLALLAKIHRKDFLGSLSKRDKETLERAIAWYQKTYLGK